MSTFSPKLLRLSALALVALAVSAGVSQADPGKGLRWSDFAFGSSSGGRTTRTTPLYYAQPVTPVAVAPTTDASGAPATITIRGADGVVRTFPVVGGVSQQLPAQGFVTVRDADGVTRTYPVANGQALPAGTVVGPAPTIWVCPPRR